MAKSKKISAKKAALMLEKVNKFLKDERLIDNHMMITRLNVDMEGDNGPCLEWRDIPEHRIDPATGRHYVVIHHICVRRG